MQNKFSCLVCMYLHKYRFYRGSSLNAIFWDEDYSCTFSKEFVISESEAKEVTPRIHLPRISFQFLTSPN